MPMKNNIEDHIINYIMGAAMMEADVRIETNKTGFCGEHYKEMLSHRGRLSSALMLDSHLEELGKTVFSVFPKSNGRSVRNAKGDAESCFVCEKAQWGMEHMLATIYNCFENGKDFSDLLSRQDMFCLKHYKMLKSGIDKRL